MLMRENTPIMLIEVKCLGANLDNKDKGFNQLYRYFSTTKAKISILTNGYEYRFYSDTDKDNILDSEPFFIFRINDFQHNDITILEHFAKSSFNDNIAEQIKYENKITDYLSEQLTGPSEKFIEFIIENALGNNYKAADTKKNQRCHKENHASSYF